MLKIKENNYHKAASLLEGIPFNTLFARAVIDGDVKGEVYVDSPDHPRTAYIVHPYGMSLLCGDAGNYNFNEKLLYYLLDNNSEYRKRQEWLQVYPAQWEEALSLLLKDKLVTYTDDLYAGNCERDYLLKEMAHSHVIRWNRLNFEFRPEEYKPVSAVLSEGLEIKKIDITSPKMLGSVVPQFFWDSYEEFLEKGIAFGVMREDRVVSIAFSAFIKNGELEIGVETAKRFRNKGLAFYCCQAMIDYCLENSLTPVWSCRKENACSLHLAERLGFRVSGSHAYYSLPS